MEQHTKVDRPRPASRAVRRTLSIALVGVAALALSACDDFNTIVRHEAPVVLTGQQQSEFERWYTGLPRIPVAVPNDGAKVLIVKFNDYLCPACGESFRAYKSVLAKYEASDPGAVRFVTRDFPLESECNTGGPHPAACEAAVAVRLARAKGKGEALEEYLFANQSGMTADKVKQAARDVGQVTDFDARYQATLEQVKVDAAYGRQLGVGSTPTFFINGVKLDGMLPPVYFDQAIAYELGRAK